MAEPSQWIKHVESFVDSTHSPTHQAESRDAIASLLKSDLLTMEVLVKELGMYLTTTDNIIRSRGIILLAELLKCLASKPLNSATIHSLIVFFTERLADWKALRGGLVGCLALLRRKHNAGMVSSSDAEAVALSYTQNIQVQSLGQEDRKLCFELLGCLLDCFPDAVSALGDDLIHGLCESIDGEKDPECLMLIFHVIEVLAQLFPGPSGPLASFAQELFEFLGCYFPIHFTHPKNEDVDLKRDDLSRALMLAFGSTPLFEPFAIPLLLEKLSSSLPLAKIDSLKYLSYCTLKYGVDRMEKHAKTIWSPLKNVICTSQQEPVLSLGSESEEGMCSEENRISTESLTLLQNLILQNENLFLSLIVSDEDIKTTMTSLGSFRTYNDMKLRAIGSILSVAAKVSSASCNRLFQNFFPLLMGVLGISNENYISAQRLNIGALYLCVELLTACRDLVVGPKLLTPESVYANETWCGMLQSCSSSLTNALTYTLLTRNGDTLDENIYFGVKGLEILATFPGGCLPTSKSTFESILTTLMLVITQDFDRTRLWELTLKGLVQIGLFIDRLPQSEKSKSYMDIVVEKLISLISRENPNMPFLLKLEAISGVGAAGLDFMLRIAQGLEEAILANLSEIYINGSSSSAEILVQILQSYSKKVLPWFSETGSSEEVPLRFAVSIWNQIESCKEFSFEVQHHELLTATVMAMKIAVGGCFAKNQSIIIQKAYTILSLKASLPSEKSDYSFSHQDEWIISLFASVIIAIRPETPIPNLGIILQLFIKTLPKGHVPGAQALGSLVNKLPLKTNTNEISIDCGLDKALHLIFNGDIVANTNVGLAWIGKGLLMRGDERVKDVIKTFLRVLDANVEIGVDLKSDSLDDSSEHNVRSLMTSAGDAFHILMGDSEDCLNRRFHAYIRPLYKQRFFSTVMPMLLSSLAKSDSSVNRYHLYRAFGNVISNTPIVAILSEAKKLIPTILDALSVLSEDIMNKDMIYSLLLVLSGILMDKNGQEAVIENTPIIINCLTRLVSYPYMLLVRETAIQCLVAMSGLPHTRIYPMKKQVLKAVLKAIDDPKRAVRREAVRCQQAWASTASRSLHF